MLHWACDRGNEVVVRFLLDQEVDVHVKDKEELSPLDYACICEHQTIIRLLVDLEGGF